MALRQRVVRPLSVKIPDGNRVNLYQGNYALVIGAINYQDNAWWDQGSVGEDVKAVRQALKVMTAASLLQLVHVAAWY